ncbi:DUF1223 domain-containing protein [Tunturiibacter lichenicola]|uniref:DUF1223 domain-containing protein n=1 Tax=Tunturiibacter lichenicola TaxID=2051959 RepID=UPI0021B3B66A|nr:DUF1223 domain-containing protein [Edaphobacter lichenicola]
MSQLRNIFAALSLLSVVNPIHAQTTTSNRTPVLVELFTSEGCSSCPPADALLAKLDHDQPIQNADIIILGEHVDYWDNLGWHDRFSSHQYTERQSQYSASLNTSGAYTPQMIVDGTDQFVGNDVAHAQRAITHAAQTAKLNLSLSKPIVDARKVSAVVTLSAIQSHPNGDLYAALVDPVDTTNVRNGENGGRRLQHAGVVRSLQRIGNLKQLNNAPLSFSLTAPADANIADMRIVVFAQQSGPGKVIGAVEASVTP